LYNQGYRDYLRHKLFIQLSPEERSYTRDHSAPDNAIPFVAQYDNYPVAFYNEHEKEWQGIAFDVIREIEELAGLRFVPANSAPIEWPVLLRMLEKGEAAMATELIRTTEREGCFLWANNPFQTDYYALLSSSRYPNVTPSEVPYSKVGLIDATAYAEVFRKWFPRHGNTLIYPTTSTIFNALERGDVDLVMATRNLLLGATHYMERPGFKVNFQFDRPYASTFGFNIQEDVLRSIVDKALRLIDTDVITGRWTRRVFDYKSKELQKRMSRMTKAAISLSCVTVFLTLALLAHLRIKKHLKKLLQERTKDLALQRETAENALCEVQATSRNKNDFLDRVNREVRIPLDAVIEMTRTAGKAENRETRDAAIEEIEAASNRLLETLDALLGSAEGG
jgi:ABC-type amino acid transport substrate-binding protein